MEKSTMRICITVLVVLGIFSFMACGGGGGGGGGDAGPATRLAFVTSTKGTGNLSTWADAGGNTGLAAADAVCQASADAGAHPGTFVAWMSDSADDAYCRAHGLTGKKADNCGQSELPTFAGPWVKVDGTPFAAQLDVALDDGVIYTPANIDEMGTVLGGSQYYWTGTKIDGTEASWTCSDWTDTGAGENGSTAATTGKWSGGWTANGASNFHLLCLETGSNNSMPAFGDSGKVVFISSATGNGRMGSWIHAGGETGVAAGDKICQNLASDAGLARASSFKAWLSDSTTNAVDHITSDGPWVRVDGIKVADNMSALVNTGPMTGISVTESGDYYSGNVFTGTVAAGTLVAPACSDWTSNSGSLVAERGSSSLVTGYWTDWTGSSQCGLNQRIYCFED